MSFASPASGQDNLTSLLPRFLSLIVTRTGLQIRDKDHRDLERHLRERMNALKIGRPESYLQLIEANTSLTQGEWTRLLPRLTNGESYFWRDKGQFSLLRTRLLPELIASRTGQRSLRLWSAGCSSGEEPYSLAMLIDELMPNRDGWAIDILGTDINPAALERARAGRYGAWAFRGLDIAVQEKYFERVKGEFQIKPQLQKMVTFTSLNLRGDDFPSRVAGIYDVDLILCRNVLIYFSNEAIAHALKGFARSLRMGGYLLTGHAELANNAPSPLVPRAFAESVAYQMCSGPVVQKAAPPVIEFQSRPSTGTIPATAVRADELRAGLQPLPVKKANLIPLPVENVGVIPSPFATAVAKTNSVEVPPVLAPALNPALKLCKQARAAADLARYADAVRLCREAVALDSTCAEAYAIWAQVEGEMGHIVEAKNLLKKVIYLAPDRFDTHLEMASLYEVEGDAVRSKRERQAALELVRSLPPTQVLDLQPGLTAGELREHLEEVLGMTHANAPMKGGR